MAATQVSSPATKDAPAVSPDLPACDPSLPRRLKEIYQNLVVWAAASGNALKQVDSIGITQVARRLWIIETAQAMADDGDTPPERVLAALKQMDTADKGLSQWLNEMGLTPKGRATLGLKPVPEKKGGRLSELIAARQGRR